MSFNDAAEILRKNRLVENKAINYLFAYKDSERSYGKCKWFSVYSLVLLYQHLIIYIPLELFLLLELWPFSSN